LPQKKSTRVNSLHQIKREFKYIRSNKSLNE